MSDDFTIMVRPNDSALAQHQGSGDWTAYTGWTDQRVTRGIERCPSDFEVSATASGPAGQLQANVAPGWLCKIMLGDDLIFTGYVDRVSPELSVTEHKISIVGRSKCADLVDCSATFSTFQLNTTNPVAIAQLLTSQFGIDVKQIGNIGETKVGNPVIPQFGVTLSETAYEIIERVCRFAALLAYDDTDGNLILTRAGSQQMASGFTQGQNIQEASAEFSMDQRYSIIETVYMSTDTLFTAPGQDGETAADAFAKDLVANASAADPNVSRYRPLLLIADMNDLVYTVAQQRAQWEVARRYGRSRLVRLTVDSWRDSQGKLWEINTLAPLDLPAFSVNNVMWLITEVTFRRGLDGGTLADLVLMPKEAMLPEPIVIQTLDPAIAQALFDQYGAAALPPSRNLNLPSVRPIDDGGAGL